MVFNDKGIPRLLRYLSSESDAPAAGAQTTVELAVAIQDGIKCTNLVKSSQVIEYRECNCT